MKKFIITVIVIIVVALAAFLIYRATDKDDAPSNTASDTTPAPTAHMYTNDVSGYQFTYPNSWNAVTDTTNAGNVLFGPGATNETGNGGVELLGELKEGQTLAAFVKTSNAGVEAGSKSETPATINNHSAIISILPGPGAGREVKSVAFQNGNKVFGVYIGYTSSDKESLLDGFDNLVNTFTFTK